MPTDLTDCDIHVECEQISSHIYQDRFYNLSVFLKHRGVPKCLDKDNEVQIITSIIASDTQQIIQSNDFIFQNPSKFNKSGYTESKFKIMSLTKSLQSYRIQCSIPNSPVTPWISPPFTVVLSIISKRLPNNTHFLYHSVKRNIIGFVHILFFRKFKFGMTRELELIDGDKWYKDEGGKTNFLEFTMGLHNNKDEYIKTSHDIKFELELVYANDKTKVLNQNILKIDPDQYYILNHQIGCIDIRFKIEQVSSHHQRRRFSLKVIPLNDAHIGPCFSKPILVLSKRNKPKKPLLAMSPQKRKEVATKRKQQKKRKRQQQQAMSLLADEPGFVVDDEEDDNNLYGLPAKKRKIMGIDGRSMSELTDSNEDHLYDSNEDESLLKDEYVGLAVNGGKNKLNGKYDGMEDEEICQQLMMKQCAIKPEQFPSIQKYEKDPNKYFDFGPIIVGKKKKKKEGGDGMDSDTESESDNENADGNYLVARKLKKNLVNCLRLCQDVFGVLSSRPMYYPMFGMGKEYTSKMVYYCSFCHRFATGSPSCVNHYEHCRVKLIYRLCYIYF